MESNTNGESFIKRFEGKESDWKEYLALTPEMQSEYQKAYKNIQNGRITNFWHLLLFLITEEILCLV